MIHRNQMQKSKAAGKTGGGGGGGGGGVSATAMLPEITMMDEAYVSHPLEPYIEMADRSAGSGGGVRKFRLGKDGEEEEEEAEGELVSSAPVEPQDEEAAALSLQAIGVVPIKV